ncbi:hypothetical protein D3C81_1777260 [compost metagenome]
MQDIEDIRRDGGAPLAAVAHDGRQRLRTGNIQIDGGALRQIGDGAADGLVEQEIRYVEDAIAKDRIQHDVRQIVDDGGDIDVFAHHVTGRVGHRDAQRQIAVAQSGQIQRWDRQAPGTVTANAGGVGFGAQADANAASADTETVNHPADSL